MRMLAFAFALVTASTIALGQESKQDHFQCRLFRVQQDQQQLTVIRGDYQQSGARGEDSQEKQQRPDQAKQYKIRIDDSTKIHWSGGQQQSLTLAQLQDMSQRAINIPMEVYYSGQLTEDQPVQATEIVVRGRPQENR